jgi:hypothetical protein
MVCALNGCFFRHSWPSSISKFCAVLENSQKALSCGVACEVQPTLVVSQKGNSAT